MNDVFARGTHVHVVGCAGAGMSGLARLLLDRGCVVSGCDTSDAPELTALSREGVVVYRGHGSNHLDGVDLVTASAAVPKDHSELAASRRRGISVLPRASVLAELSRLAEVIAFAGTHGKTTTTSMAAMIWNAAGVAPSWLIGAPVRGLGPNGRWREGGDLLLEADESYGAFSDLLPAALGVLNVEPDHLDHYGDVASLEAAFRGLVERCDGPVSAWNDQEGARRVSRAARSLRTVGRTDGVDVRVSEERWTIEGSHFVLQAPEGRVEITLGVPGALNVANGAMAASVALSLGLDTDAVVAGLASFRGAPRRFEWVTTTRGTAIVDDYAHLPGEVAATIDAARSMGFERIAAVFQPHRVTRTRALAPSFAGAFAGVEFLVVVDIYRSGEANPEGLTGELVAHAVSDGMNSPKVVYRDTLEAAAGELATQLGDADLILVLGAGDVHRVIPMMLAAGSS